MSTRAPRYRPPPSPLPTFRAVGPEVHAEDADEEPRSRRLRMPGESDHLRRPSLTFGRAALLLGLLMLALGLLARLLPRF